VEALSPACARSVSRPNPQQRSLGRAEGGGGHPACGRMRQLIVAPGPACCSRCWANLTLAGTLPASPAWCALWFTPWWPGIALVGPGRPILVRRASRQAAHGWPSMDTLVGLGMGRPTGQPGSPFSGLALVGPVFFNERVMLLGFVLLGRFLRSGPGFRTGPCPPATGELQPRFRPAPCSADGPARRGRGGCAPGDGCACFPPATAFPSMCGSMGCRRWIVFELPTGEPCRWRAQPARILAPGFAQFSGPAVLEVRRLWRQNGPGPDHRLVEQARGAQSADPEPRRRIAAVSGWLVLAAGPGHVCVLGSGAPGFVAQGVGRRAQGHGGMAACRARGRWRYAFSLALQLANCRASWWACPCAWAWPRPPPSTVGAGLAARSALRFPRWGDASR